VVESTDSASFRAKEQRLTVAIIANAKASRQSVDRKPLLRQLGRYCTAALSVHSTQVGGYLGCLVGERNRTFSLAARHHLGKSPPIVRSPLPTTEVQDWAISLAQGRA
jgi:hypothetical protein